MGSAEQGGLDVTAKEMLELEWSCDERDRRNCRNAHGCHCAEITSLLSRLAAQADARCSAVTNTEPVAWLITWKDADEQEQRVFNSTYRKDDWLDRLAEDDLVSDIIVTPLYPPPQPADSAPAVMPQNVEVAIRRMRTLADSALGNLYEVECQREMRNACVLLEEAYKSSPPPAQASAVTEHDYALMPREATRAMTMAGCDSLPACEHVFGYAGEMLRNAYRKMVEAAPQPADSAPAADPAQGSSADPLDRALRTFNAMLEKWLDDGGDARLRDFLPLQGWQAVVSILAARERSPAAMGPQEAFIKIVDDLHPDRAESRVAESALVVPANPINYNLINCLTGCANLLDQIKLEWSEENAWSEWDQSIRDAVTKHLKEEYARGEAQPHPAASATQEALQCVKKHLDDLGSLKGWRLEEMRTKVSAALAESPSQPTSDLVNRLLEAPITLKTGREAAQTVVDLERENARLRAQSQPASGTKNARIEGMKAAFEEVAEYLDRRKFQIDGAKDWVGNWCWNGFKLPRAEAKRLLGTLRESGRWRCTHGPCRWFDWFNREGSFSLAPHNQTGTES